MSLENLRKSNIISQAISKGIGVISDISEGEKIKQLSNLSIEQIEFLVEAFSFARVLNMPELDNIARDVLLLMVSEKGRGRSDLVKIITNGLRGAAEISKGVVKSLRTKLVGEE